MMTSSLQLNELQDGMGFYYGMLRLGDETYRIKILPPRARSGFLLLNPCYC
jgi:hypothetical protein